MRIIVCENEQEMSRKAGQLFLEQVYKNPDQRRNLAVTAGKTPRIMYELIVPVIRQFPNENVDYYCFDEIPVRQSAAGLTFQALNSMFFQPASIPSEQLHSLDVNQADGVDQQLESCGGLQWILMGLGLDGHFCGNLSGTLKHFGEGTHLISCQMNERIHKRMLELCGTEENMPDAYVTFGPKTVMNAEKLTVIASGKAKAEIVKKVVEDPVTLDVPASILLLHPDVTFVLDKDAASLLNPQHSFMQYLEKN